MHVPKPKRQADTRLYLLLASMVLCTIAYVMWPAGSAIDDEATAQLVSTLLKENARLRAENLELSQAPALRRTEQVPPATCAPARWGGRVHGCG